MSYDIKASHRNKKFITNIVNALRSNDTALFADLFSKHGSQEFYKVPAADLAIGTDFRLFSEIAENIKVFREDSAHTIIEAMPLIGEVSTATKIAIYLAAYSGIDNDTREIVFGNGSAFYFTDKIDDMINEHRYEFAHEGTIPYVLNKLYLNSITENQNPDDFVSKFKLMRSLGINKDSGANRLDYRLNEKFDSEKYTSILSRIDREDAKRMVADNPHHFLSYENLKEYGALAFGRLSIGKRKGDNRHPNYMAESFAKEDFDLFGDISSAVIPYSSVDEVKAIVLEILTSVDQSRLSENQAKAIDDLDKVISKKSEKEFINDITSHRWDFAAPALLQMIMSGNKRMVEDHFSSLPNEGMHFLNVALAQIDIAMPKLIKDGVIGEVQKEILLHLHDIAAKNVSLMRDRLMSIDTSQAYRIEEQLENKLVSIPISELTQEQRERWASPGNETDRVSAYRGPRRRDYDGFEPTR